jgi:DNA anti-recombination protein RmuC
LELINAASKAETRTLVGSITESPKMPMTAQEAFEAITRANASDPSMAQLESWFATLERKAKSGDLDAQEILAILDGGEQRAAQAQAQVRNAEITGGFPVEDEPGRVADRPKTDDKAQKASAAEMKKALEAVEKRCAEIQAKHHDDLKTLLERKKKEFARKLTELYEKQAELARAEKPSGPVLRPVSDGPSS